MTARQRGRRAALTEAVIDLLQETEPDRIQMREVSERSGVALGTLYRYFPTKEHLMAASMEAWNDRLSRKLEVERAGRSPPASPTIAVCVNGCSRCTAAS